MLVKPRADQAAEDRAFGAALHATAVQCHLDNAAGFLCAAEIARRGGAFREAVHSLFVARREMDSAERLMGGGAAGARSQAPGVRSPVTKPNGRML